MPTNILVFLYFHWKNVSKAPKFYYKDTTSEDDNGVDDDVEQYEDDGYVPFVRTRLNQYAYAASAKKVSL